MPKTESIFFFIPVSKHRVTERETKLLETQNFVLASALTFTYHFFLMKEWRLWQITKRGRE